MDILPILSTLKRHKTAAGLIVLQIALTCAIVCNALFLISERVALIQAPTGLAERELLVLNVSSIVRAENPEAQTRVDLAALRALPGVKSVTLMNQLPFANSFSVSGVRKTAGDAESAVSAANYSAGEGWLQTLGLRLAAGRDFEPADYVDGAAAFKDGQAKIASIILNKRLAERLFPGGSALGQTVYIYGDAPQQVVGVLEELPSPFPKARSDENLYTMVMPIRPSYRSGPYVLRVDAGQRDATLKAAAAALQKSGGPRRVLREQKRFEDMRDAYYQQDRFMVGLLIAVCLALLAVTAFGIVGLASFWVQQRSRMIGTRRALGATRGQILRYFQTENFLLSSIGIALGLSGAYAINLLLMTQYELPRLPLLYLPAGALCLWALGQLAVLGPARRAAALPPMLVMRGTA